MVFFTCTFLLVHFTGALTVEKIKGWLEFAQTASLMYVVLVVILLMFADLLIPVPSLPVMLFTGYLIGPFWATVATMTGLLLAGSVGYGLSYRYGDKLVKFILKNEEKRKEAIATYLRHGPIVIILSRAVPMLPEVSACMAGLSRIPFVKFVALWMVGMLPYTVVATYAGHKSSIENPQPAIIAVLCLIGSLWTGWFYFSCRNRVKS